jgi:hypothetical protein
VSERLAFVRAREELLVDRDLAEKELEGLATLFAEGNWPSLRRTIAAYHRVRLKLAGTLVAALHRPPS